MQESCSTLWTLLTDSGFATFWTAIGSIFTAVGAVAVIFAAMKLDFNAWVKAQEIFTQTDFTEARGVVLPRYRTGKSVPWTPADKDKAMIVCRKMDEFARLIPFLRRPFVLKTWYDPIGKCWDVLEGIVLQEQQDCDWPEKWAAFEQLGKAARQRLKKRA